MKKPNTIQSLRELLGRKPSRAELLGVLLDEIDETQKVENACKLSLGPERLLELRRQQYLALGRADILVRELAEQLKPLAKL